MATWLFFDSLLEQSSGSVSGLRLMKSGKEKRDETCMFDKRRIK